MPIITKLEVQKNDETRANLYLDDKFFAGISIEIIMKNQIKKGMEISAEKLEELILQDEKSKALTKAVKYISGNLKTIKQIRDYLRKKEYNKITIDYVIEKMQEYGYLDDEAYAKAYILTNSKKYGKLKLVSELRNKGVSEKIIDTLFEEDIEMLDSIEAVAEKYLKNKVVDEKTLQRLSRFLYSRGYEFDKINRIINEKRGEK